MSAAPKRARRPHPWAGGLLCGLGIAFLPGTLLFLATMLAPALLALAFGRGADRPAPLPILLAGLAATAAPLLSLWQSGPPPVARALDLLADPRVLAPAWLAAGAAWMLSEAMVFGAGRALAAGAAHRLRRLDREIAGLCEEWSMPESGDPAPGADRATSKRTSK